MSLVAYASSGSESEPEDNDELTSDLAAPAPKKARETAKITIPSLQEFKDEDAKPEPKKFQAKSGSGLFSVLPPPKHSTTSSVESFVPYIFTKKKVTKTTPSTVKNVKKDATESALPGSSIESEPVASSNAHEESSTPVVDYFSFGDSSNTTTVPQIESKSALFSSLPQPVQNSESYEEAPSSSYDLPSYSGAMVSDDQAENSFAQPSWDENYQNPLSEESAQTSFLNDEGFKKIKGRRDTQNIDIIDVNAGDQLTGKDQWLLKSLTEERVQKPSKRRHDMPTQQQKRKHQITYLAFQAKERELDLKNQWSLNSLTRRETQAKYGF